MRLQAEDDGLTSIGGGFRRLTIDVQRRVGHRQGVKLLVHALGALSGGTHTRLRDAAPTRKNALLGGHQLTLDSGRIGPGRRKFLDTRASLVGPCEEALDVSRAPTQYVFDSRSSRVNLRKPLRISIEA